MRKLLAFTKLLQEHARLKGVDMPKLVNDQFRQDIKLIEVIKP